MIQFFQRRLKAQNSKSTDCNSCKESANPKNDHYSLLKAGVDFVRGDFAEDSLKAERLAICKGCEYLFKGSNCKLCGCFVHIKAGLANASCDIHKW